MKIKIVKSGKMKKSFAGCPFVIDDPALSPKK